MQRTESSSACLPCKGAGTVSQLFMERDFQAAQLSSAQGNMGVTPVGLRSSLGSYIAQVGSGTALLMAHL